MKRKKIYGIFMLVAIAVFLFAGGRILQIYLNYQESQKVYEQMEGFTQKIEDQDLSPEAVPGETPEEVAEQGFLQVDFNKLEEINPDVIAWIEIPGLEISYPVVQGRDNDYYLHHLITGENHKSGSIFMDFHNQEDLSDRNTIIYGHNMKDGSMFGGLKKYRDPSFYEEHGGACLEPWISISHRHFIETIPVFICMCQDIFMSIRFFPVMQHRRIIQHILMIFLLLRTMKFFWKHYKEVLSITQGRQLPGRIRW